MSFGQPVHEERVDRCVPVVGVFHELGGDLIAGTLLQPVVHDADLRALTPLPVPVEVAPPTNLFGNRVVVLSGGCQCDAASVQRLHGCACVFKRP